MLQMTPWERSALQLLADGKTLDELAQSLRSSERDIKIQLTVLFARMGASNTKEAIADAIRRGLLTTVAKVS